MLLLLLLLLLLLRDGSVVLLGGGGRVHAVGRGGHGGRVQGLSESRAAVAKPDLDPCLRQLRSDSIEQEELRICHKAANFEFFMDGT